MVVTKSTPDTAAKVEVDAHGKVVWGTTPLVVNPWDEYAVTEATLLCDAHKSTATVITVGGEIHAEALKWALAVGCNDAVRVWDEGMDGQDSLGYAVALAAAIKKLGNAGLIIFGKEFTDVASDAHIFQTARKLGWSALGSVSKIQSLDLAAGTIKVERLTESGKESVTTRLPLVISVLKGINEPKSPSFIGIRKAAKAAIPVWSSADLGLGSAASGAAAKARNVSFSNLPARAGAVQLLEGATELEKAAALVVKLQEEKVL